ncbi:MAG: homocysteine methyltransferase [Ruminococcaceae bacterium]|nr:homocysteine methyltransferase [Oscillospiraceae bacterium]
MDIRTYMQENVLLLDGGMGTLLQQGGLQPGERPERRCLTHPEQILAIHRAYLAASSRVITANTFGANRLHYPPEELEQVIAAALRLARTAAREAGAERFVALDIGPTGRLLRPYGDLPFEEAVEIFAETVRLGAQYGADVILIETMNDSYETKAALLAAKETCTLPVMVSNAYGEDGRLTTGATPEAMIALLEGMGADAIGVNCSYGPAQLAPVVERYLAAASVPVLLQPNAGLPQTVEGVTVYDVTPEAFADAVARQVQAGVRVVGGCCGTTPAHIAALAHRLQGIAPQPIQPKGRTWVSSATHAVTLGETPVLIGERINPTGKKKLKAALVERDMTYILGQALTQQEQGAHILDVNVGLPEVDEPALLPAVMEEIQAVCDLPLQIDTADPAAMEVALRRYNGKPLINSVNGKADSMAAVFPLAKKYGGVVVALTLDEQGIPATAEGRVAIARRIVETAARYGISRENLLFDPLAMTISADNHAALTTLTALRRIRQELGCHTSLGVSNVSFGLPCREVINSTFFAAALQEGLTAAIMNPGSTAMMQVYHAHRALHGMDDSCADYIAFAATLPTAAPAVPIAEEPASGSALQEAIRKGLRAAAEQEAQRLLTTVEGLCLINDEIIPALDAVGQGYEQGRVYLPQLLMSAEAAGAACEVIKDHLRTQGAGHGRCPVVLATVRGDIHDIGKNIVKLLLENYGFAVTDLGRDVPPETVVETVCRLHAPLCALSALMTTTVPAMEETVALLHRRAPDCKVMVGGAVLNPEYAAAIGADRYGKDAMEAVRYALEVDDTWRQ